MARKGDKQADAATRPRRTIRGGLRRSRTIDSCNVAHSLVRSLFRQFYARAVVLQTHCGQVHGSGSEFHDQWHMSPNSRSRISRGFSVVPKKSSQPPLPRSRFFLDDGNSCNPSRGVVRSCGRRQRGASCSLLACAKDAGRRRRQRATSRPYCG